MSVKVDNALKQCYLKSNYSLSFPKFYLNCIRLSIYKAVYQFETDNQQRKKRERSENKEETKWVRIF